MKLARAVHFDESDMNVLHNPARTGEWCIAGGFEFSDFTEADLVGKVRQAFTNGWLGLETFGRTTFVAVTQVEPREIEALAQSLAHHFVERYGAPALDAALPVAQEELRQMTELCDEHDPGTVITVARELTGSGVKETFRIIEPRAAALDQFAVHGNLDPEP
ncbi:MAG: DUF6505 family protein [Pseudomonadota bacterium]